MKNYRIFLAAALSAAFFSACKSEKSVATITGSFNAAPACGVVTVKTPGDTSVVEIDSITLAGDGSFSYEMPVREGQPEFVYLYAGPTKVATLLLHKGDNVKVQCDTIGAWSVEGSDECSQVLRNELAISRLTSKEIVSAKDFIEHYRAMVKYVMDNSHSLTVYPVFQQKVGDYLLFGQYTDAVLMQQTVDSLETVYPDSRYTKALRTQAQQRLNQMALQQRISQAQELSYPDIALKDFHGDEVKLSEVDKGRTVLVFWASSVVPNRVYNQDVLLPLYQQMSSKGLSIYSVNLSEDVTEWTTCVKNQNLPWTNVSDFNGTYVNMYGVRTLPTVFVIRNGELKRMEDMSLEALKKALE